MATKPAPRNLLDRAIGWFAPAAGLARWQARTQIAALDGSWKGGRRDRRPTRNWRPLGGSPDAVLMSASDPAKVTAVVEVKCPVRPYDRVPHKYVLQMTTYMAVMDVRRCYLVQLSQSNFFSVTRFSLDANLFADMALKSRAFMTRVRAHRDNLQRARLFLLTALRKPRRAGVDVLLAAWLLWSPVKFAAPTTARSRGGGKRRVMELSDEPPDSLLG